MLVVLVVVVLLIIGGCSFGSEGCGSEFVDGISGCSFGGGGGYGSGFVHGIGGSSCGGRGCGFGGGECKEGEQPNFGSKILKAT